LKQIWRGWGLCCWLATWVVAGVVCDARGEEPSNRAKLEELRQRAGNVDPAVAMQAIRELDQMGDAGRAGLLEKVKGLIARDVTLVGNFAGVIDDAKVKQAEAEIAAVRVKALENLEKLAKGETVTAAKQFQVKLKELLSRVNVTYGLRWKVIEAMRRRGECGAMVLRLGEKFEEAPYVALAAQATKALGMELGNAMSIPELEDAIEPHSEAENRALWFYRVCRRIEAYNRAQTGVVNKWEARSVALLNEYREGLGLLPLEIDPRLTEAARRHSKEMCDLKYFAHASPTPGQKMPIDRMQNAGYNAGWSENICANVGDADRAFTVWFNSPGHHLAMTSPAEIAIGCGRWDNAWTHTFGHGARLMLKDEAGRAEALKPLAGGVALAAQADNAKLPPVTVTRVETEITIIDPRTGEKVKLQGK